MHIASVKATFPSRRVTNHELIELVRAQNAQAFEGDFERTLAQLKLNLELSGAVERRWIAPGEKPIALLASAVSSALTEAAARPSDIELLVYVGNGRAFAEPASAYIVAHALELPRAHCFDIIDACNSYARALFLVDALFKTGAYRTALVVNAECNMAGKGHAERMLRLPSDAHLEWTLPAFTIGEAATATVLRADAACPWEFHWDTAPELADLCTAPQDGFEGFCRMTKRMGRNGVRQFTAYGTELHMHGAPRMIEVAKKLSVPTEQVKIVLPHTSARLPWKNLAQRMGFEGLMWYLYPEYGNIGSASLPAGLATAEAAGRVRRGDRVVAVLGSAGASFVALTMVY